jgi:hypothetical protein
VSVISKEDLDAAAEVSAQQRLLRVQMHAAEAKLAMELARPLLAVAPQPFRTVFEVLATIVAKLAD